MPERLNAVDCGKAQRIGTFKRFVVNNTLRRSDEFATQFAPRSPILNDLIEFTAHGRIIYMVYGGILRRYRFGIAVNDFGNVILIFLLPRCLRILRRSKSFHIHKAKDGVLELAALFIGILGVSALRTVIIPFKFFPEFNKRFFIII